MRKYNLIEYSIYQAFPVNASEPVPVYIQPANLVKYAKIFRNIFLQIFILSITFIEAPGKFIPNGFKEIVAFDANDIYLKSCPCYK
jgi:hypothetical protein